MPSCFKNKPCNLSIYGSSIEDISNTFLRNSSGFALVSIFRRNKGSVLEILIFVRHEPKSQTDTICVDQQQDLIQKSILLSSLK